MYYKISPNVHIRNLYSPGFSWIRMSNYHGNLIFRFVPYLGKSEDGKSQYCKETFLSTSVRYDGASSYYQIAMSILLGDNCEKEIKDVIPCKNNATLTFEYKPDQGDQMAAYLIINKNNLTIPFKFPTHEYDAKVNGRMVTKVIQTGLIGFIKALEEYLAAIGADSYLKKYTEEELYNLQRHHH